MANAEASTRIYTLTLTEEEAQYLVDLLAAGVGGSGRARDVLTDNQDSILAALQAVGLRWTILPNYGLKVRFAV
jgi:hypothetical protein